MQEQKLIRAVGLKEIISLTINAIIGAGIFALPATAAGILGLASPIAFVLAGLFACIVVLCFAELGGKFDRTGGAYLYASEAFGKGGFSFVIGWMYFLARLSSVAALCAAMIGFLNHVIQVSPVLRVLIILVTFLFVGGANYIGIRFSTRVINLFTAAKLIPLFVFMAVGLTYVNWNAFQGMTFPDWKPLSQTLLIAMFVFSGFEIIAVPAAEIIEPRKTIPRGLLAGTFATIVIYFLIQVVAVGTHPGLAEAKSPIAEAAAHFMGPTAGKVITVGAVVSTIGTMLALMLVGPRIIYAMAIHDQVPSLFGKIHPLFRTPHVSILIVSSIAALLTLSGTFQKLATLSAMARLVTYAGSAIALLKLRQSHPSDSFRLPGGPVIPLLTVLISLLLLTAATREQWLSGAIALGAGILLYVLASVIRNHQGAKT